MNAVLAVMPGHALQPCARQGVLPALWVRRRAVVRQWVLIALLALGGSAVWAQADTTPDVFVQRVIDQALQAIVHNDAVHTGDPTATADIVNDYILPHILMEKTTRLAAGRYWRQASATQRQQLIEAFTSTLIRTYSSALRLVTSDTKLAILPWRGDPQAQDTVVRSTLHHGNSAPVGVDFRLEKTAQGWKIYDVNVEGIWLIQNYRNQFSQEITAHGIDGLITALNRHNVPESTRTPAP